MTDHTVSLPKRIVLIGPQGSGKGTQASTLARTLKIPHISTGDIFRTHIKRRTPLGRKLLRLLKAGTLAPDAVTNRILFDRLRSRDCRSGYILDGYPRTLNQARFLQRVSPPSVVLAFELSHAEAVKRLGGRRMAPDGTIYHLRYNPPPNALRGKLFIRDDDRAEAVRHRLRIYRREARPLLRFYQARGILLRINGQPPIPTVTKNILAALKFFWKSTASRV